MMVRAQGGAGKSRCSQVSQVRARVTEEAEEARGGAAVQAGFPNPKGQCRAFPQGAWGEGRGWGTAWRALVRLSQAGT